METALTLMGMVWLHASAVAFERCTYRYFGGIFMHQLGVEQGGRALRACLDSLRYCTDQSIVQTLFHTNLFQHPCILSNGFIIVPNNIDHQHRTNTETQGSTYG